MNYNTDNIKNCLAEFVASSSCRHRVSL